MFQATTQSLLLSYLRVPHSPAPADDGDPLGRLWAANGRSLLWPARSERPASAFRWGEIPLFVSLVPDGENASLLPAEAGWRPSYALDHEGPRASVWRSDDGSVYLPFSPDEAVECLWSERYREVLSPRRSLTSGARRLAMRTYYLVRPVLPRRLQIGLRRGFSRLQAQTAFPRWPLETALPDFLDRLLALLAALAGEPVPWLSPWPEGRAWALVLTHDVETKAGYDAISLLRTIEREHGYRSSWNLVPRRYDVADEVVEDLQREGFEVGVHGLFHDGRDLESRARLEERLPEIRSWAERWRAVGFRSPATLRQWELMPLLGFDYDSSYPDTDPFEPQGGGCCSLLPFENDGLVELPITLPQDHTLFVILRKDDTLWASKAEAVRARGGMALLITHPDYMLDQTRLDAYARFLARYQDDESCWRALPRDVADWWRRRAASSVVRSRDGWRIEGPAATEGSLRHAPAGDLQAAYL
jgi:hypothetical protein